MPLKCHSNLFRGCQAGDQLQHLEDIDDIAMCAQLMAILHNNNTCQILLSRRGAEAQFIIDLLQEVHLNFVSSLCQTHGRIPQLCGDTDLGPGIKSTLLKALIELAEASCRYPQSLLLSHGVQISSNPVSGGGSNNIYKGLLREQPVAVKAVRKYPRRDWPPKVGFFLTGCEKKTLSKFLVIQEFAREVIIWRQLCHPNILPLYGVHHQNNDTGLPCVILPWMEYHDITWFLKKFSDENCASLVSAYLILSKSS
jgi:serine/threonine protein kinase